MGGLRLNTGKYSPYKLVNILVKDLPGRLRSEVLIEARIAREIYRAGLTYSGKSVSTELEQNCLFSAAVRKLYLLLSAAGNSLEQFAELLQVDVVEFANQESFGPSSIDRISTLHSYFYQLASESSLLREAITAESLQELVGRFIDESGKSS